MLQKIDKKKYIFLYLIILIVWKTFLISLVPLTSGTFDGNFLKSIIFPLFPKITNSFEFFITLIAIIVVGPKDLPVVIRSLSRWVFQTKNIVKDFQHSLEESIKETEINEITKELAVTAKETELAVINTNTEYIDLEADSKNFEHQSHKK